MLAPVRASQLVLPALACLGLGAVAAPVAAAQAPEPPTVETPVSPRAGSPLTPVVVENVPQREIVAVKGSDGHQHVLYELLLTNSVDGPVRLGPLRILDTRTGRTVGRWSVRKMISSTALHQLNRQDVKNAVIGTGESRLLTLNVTFRTRAAIPRRLTNRFQVTAANPFTGKRTRFTYDAGAVRISRRVPPVYAPPLDGSGWVASDGCCGATGHVNAMLGLNGKLQAAERFAIDWMRIGPDGRMYQGDPSNPASWYAYGAPVKAVSDGVVQYARSDQPDQVPGKMPTNLQFDELIGNAVILRQSSGLRQIYVHLAPGSVTVKAGDRVSAGQVLGRLGNSGASLAPHLHFHVVNGPNPATSDGFPYTIDRFSVGGTASVENLLAGIKGEASFPTPDQIHYVPHQDELPLSFSIVDFP